MRSSAFRFVSLAAVLVVGGCSQQPQRNVGYANVNLSFSADPAKVEPIVADVQKRFLALGDAGKHASVNVNSGNNSGMNPAASTVPVESMSLALDDARRKAGEIAQHDGALPDPVHDDPDRPRRRRRENVADAYTAGARERDAAGTPHPRSRQRKRHADARSETEETTAWSAAPESAPDSRRRER